MCLSFFVFCSSVLQCFFVLFVSLLLCCFDSLFLPLLLFFRVFPFFSLLCFFSPPNGTKSRNAMERLMFPKLTRIKQKKTRCSPRTRMLTRMLMVQMSKHMDMQSRTTLFCNSWFEESCTYFPCCQSAVWSGKFRVWSVECKVRSVK